MKMTDMFLAEIARKAVAALQEQGLKLATAESCTGGWVAKLITDIPGSSAVFDRGFVTYSNSAKQQQLSVEEGLLLREGAVSEGVARAMASGTLGVSGADVSLSITGIAGPGGGTPEKPVGTVWIAWADPSVVEASCFHFEGERDEVRRQAVAAALEGMISRIAS